MKNAVESVKTINTIEKMIILIIIRKIAVVAVDEVKEDVMLHTEAENLVKIDIFVEEVVTIFKEIGISFDLF